MDTLRIVVFTIPICGVAGCGDSTSTTTGNGGGGASTTQTGSGANGAGGTGGVGSSVGGMGVGGMGVGGMGVGGMGVGGMGVGGGDCLGLPVSGVDLPDVVDFVPGVTVTTLAGSSTLGTADGTGASAEFDNPANLLLVPPSTLYVADFDNGRVRTSTLSGDVSTLTNQPDFARPFGLAWTISGDLIVETDFDENAQNAGVDSGVIWTVDPVSGTATPLVTMAGRPRGLIPLSTGYVVVTDIFRHDVRLLDPLTGLMVGFAGLDACPGYVDANGADARFNRPYGGVVTATGDVLLADQNNNVIRQISPAGDVTTFAGDGVADMIDGDLASARFDHPQDLAIDAAGNVYVADVGNHRVRVIQSDGTVRTVAGDGVAGFANGGGAGAEFFGMEGIEVASDGKTLFVADGTNGDPVPYHRVRAISIP